MGYSQELKDAINRATYLKGVGERALQQRILQHSIYGYGWVSPSQRRVMHYRISR